jgi:hypothetical protein
MKPLYTVLEIIVSFTLHMLRSAFELFSCAAEIPDVSLPFIGKFNILSIVTGE